MVSTVVGVISTTMAQVDSPDECNVALKTSGMSKDDQLLVVRSASAYSLVKQNFATRLGHVDFEASILLRAKRETVTVRTPEQPSNVDSSST
jgi:hypothetical protein